MLKRIIPGGQTGVDQAALDAAIACNIRHGGCCPKGRLAELVAVAHQQTISKQLLISYRMLTSLRLTYS